MRVRIALALALVAIATGLVIDMSGAAPRLAGSDHVHWPAAQQLTPTLPGGGTLCAPVGTVLPADAARLVVTIGSYGRRLPRLVVLFTPTGGRSRIVGGLPAGGSEGEAVSIPLDRHHGPSASGAVCLRAGGREPLAFYGWSQNPPTTINGTPANGAVSMLFYRAGSESWWQLLGALDLRFGLGKWGFFSDWTLPAIALAALLLWFGVTRVLMRDVRPTNAGAAVDEPPAPHSSEFEAAIPTRGGARTVVVRRAIRRVPRATLRAWSRIPRAGRACFVIAFVNIAIWTVIVPPFQVPDEISHFAYAQYLAETGQPPPQTQNAGQYSPQENAALYGLDWGSTIGSVYNRGVFTPAENSELRAILAANDDPLGPGGATVATAQPPLYYALEVIPYWLSPSNSILARLELMRLLSALMAACTVLAIYLFLREIIPRTPWMWTVGALMVAFQPMFAFIGAGVQGDNLLYLASALTFLATARAWRRGLTTRRGVAIGAALAVGMLAKLTFLAIVPGVLLALALLAWRARSAGRTPTLRALAAAVAVASAPVLLYALLNVTVWNRGSALAGGLASVTSQIAPATTSVRWHQIIDYTWELFFPRLSFMNHAFFAPGQWQLWQLWLDGAIGHFGWLDYQFPMWVYNDFRDVVYGLAALGAIGLWRVRHALRSLGGLLVSYSVMGLGLIGVIGYLGANAAIQGASPFPQARYLFPLLALYALAIVLATKGLPRRWAPVLGALLVALAMAHNLFAMTLTISRYYG